MSDRPEFELLVLLSRENMPDDTLERAVAIAPLCQDVRRFVRCAVNQKTALLILRNLLTLTEFVSTPFVKESVQALKRLLIGHWIPKRSRLRRVLAEVRETLNLIDCPFAFLKGPVFADSYYDDGTLRMCGDLDVLVPQHARFRVQSAMLGSGFRYVRNATFRRAQDTFIGQVEFAHEETGVVVDVNWRLTENSGIGPLSLDMDDVWTCVEPLTGCEHQLSSEHLFLHLVRHFAHGHDFNSALLQCCTDVTALLNKTGNRLDWHRVQAQLRECECTHAVAFIAWFYDHFYRDSTMSPLSDHLGDTVAAVPRGESRSFYRLILKRHLRGRHMPLSPVSQLLEANVQLLAKLWALDNSHRLVKLLRVTVWASRNELVLLNDEHSTGSWISRRIHLYGTFALVLPALILGSVCCVASCIWRRVRTRVQDTR